MNRYNHRLTPLPAEFEAIEATYTTKLALQQKNGLTSDILVDQQGALTSRP